MKNESQKRILLLLHFLYRSTDETHSASVTEILQFWREHGVQASRKSVYGDIDLLEQMGVDIIRVKSTQNRYFIGQRLFELPELKLLADAVESSRLITVKKSGALIGKLCKLTSKAQAARRYRPVHMAGTAKPDNEAVYYIVDTIHTAIREQKQVSFQYYEYTPRKEKVLKHNGLRYVFSPYALLWNRDYYYAVGYSEKHGKLAQFRVDRMTGIALLEESAVPGTDFDPADYVRGVFGMYGVPVRTMELLCDNEVMRSVVDRFGADVRTEPGQAGRAAGPGQAGMRAAV